ncbi:MAG: hypothetical protein ABI895_34275 [Deltaproteobacteria bacterium]
MPQTANVVQLPDDATTGEVQGQYGVGLTVLLFGGLLTAGALYGLLVLLLGKTWGGHARAGGRPLH